MEANLWGLLPPHLCPPAFQSDLCVPHFSLWVLSLPPWGLFCSHLSRCSRDLAVLQVSTLNQEILPSVLAAIFLCSWEARLSTSQLLIQNDLLFSSLEGSPWLNFFTTWIPLASAFLAALSNHSEVSLHTLQKVEKYKDRQCKVLMRYKTRSN